MYMSREQRRKLAILRRSRSISGAPSWATSRCCSRWRAACWTSTCVPAHAASSRTSLCQTVTPGSKTLNSRILGARWHAVKAGMPRVEMSLHRRPYVEFQNRPCVTIRKQKKFKGRRQKATQPDCKPTTHETGHTRTREGPAKRQAASSTGRWGGAPGRGQKRLLDLLRLHPLDAIRPGRKVVVVHRHHDARGGWHDGTFGPQR